MSNYYDDIDLNGLKLDHFKSRHHFKNDFLATIEYFFVILVFFLKS